MDISELLQPIGKLTDARSAENQILPAEIPFTNVIEHFGVALSDHQFLSVIVWITKPDSVGQFKKLERSAPLQGHSREILKKEDLL